MALALRSMATLRKVNPPQRVVGWVRLGGSVVQLTTAGSGVGPGASGQQKSEIHTGGRKGRYVHFRDMCLRRSKYTTDSVVEAAGNMHSMSSADMYTDLAETGKDLHVGMCF